MFNWGYAIIGFVLGFLFGSIKSSDTKTDKDIPKYPSILFILIAGFLMFSASFGVEWLVVGIVEVFIGGFVGGLIGKKQ